MIRRSIVSRFAAAAVMLTPALALAAGSAHDHAAGRGTKHCACDCNHGQQSLTGASGSTGSPASTTTSAEDLQKIWTDP